MTKENNNTKILLVSDNEGDVENIKLRLEESIYTPCYIWHCLTLAEALEYLDKKKLRADIIILDLGLNGTASPKEIYDKIGKAARNIPIIVLTGTGEKEQDLATFVMEAGAADNVIRGQFSRLKDAIEFSLIRHRIATTASDRILYDREHLQSDHDSAMTEAKRKNDEKNQYISWITGGYSVGESPKKP